MKKTPPTLVIEAIASKHRKRDEFPLHDDLVAMLEEWLADLAPDEPLSPQARQSSHVVDGQTGSENRCSHDPASHRGSRNPVGS
ncbi:MAG: hypothetical protein MK179_14960 [Pirellulaceae bacterium]|nr:hypothetical protein [Pirellulaceae bacterium]